MRRTGRIDASSMATGPWASAWVLVNVYGFLIVAVLSVYFQCVLRFGGQMASVWSDPHVLGLSLHTIASLVNGLLFVLVLGTIYGASLSRRMGVITGVTALLMTAGVQVTLNGWKRAATWDIERAIARGEAAAVQVAKIESELASLTEHPWAGRYRGEWNDGVVRYWFAPKAGFACAWVGPEYSEDASEASRALHSFYSHGALVVAGNQIRMEGAFGFGTNEFYVVPWGERRYLVTSATAQGFWDNARDGQEVLLDYRIVLREGDEARPVAGVPMLPPELAAIVR
jgi:hypothetical protein